MTALQTIDPQSIFDKVWQHFVVDRAPAGKDDDGKPCYHYTSPEGEYRCCGIGLLDEDRHLVGKLANKTVTHLLDENSDAFNGVFSVGRPQHKDKEFLTKLQRAHDFAATAWAAGPGFHYDIRMNLLLLANDFNLTAPQ